MKKHLKKEYKKTILLVQSLSNLGSNLFIAMLILFICFNAEAQSKELKELGKANLYADFGFHLAGQATVNLEYQIASAEKVTWYGRVGAGAGAILMVSGGPGMLGGVTMLTGKGNKHFEISGGAFLGRDIELKETFVYPMIDFGYRYQKPEGGFIFKAKVGFLGIGIGLGYAF